MEKHEDAVFIQGFEFPSLSLRQLLRYPEPEEGDILCDFGLGVCRIVSLSESAVSVPRGPRSFVTLRTLVFFFLGGGPNVKHVFFSSLFLKNPEILLSTMLSG